MSPNPTVTDAPLPPHASPLPATSSPAWESLHPNARTAMRLFGASSLGGVYLVPAAMLLIAWDSLGWSGGVRVAAWAIGALLVLLAGWVAGGVRWSRTGFALDAAALRIRRGIFWRSETLVPRSRVQHTDLNRGPLDRRLGLATLKVYTAGTKLASVSLDGLPAERAAELRDALVAADDDAV
jgi:uncharacterized protein